MHVYVHVRSSRDTIQCTFAAGVEQGCLKAHRTAILQALIDGDVHGVAVVRVHVGQGEEVGGANEEVPVERVQTQPWGGRRVDGILHWYCTQ